MRRRIATLLLMLIACSRATPTQQEARSHGPRNVQGVSSAEREMTELVLRSLFERAETPFVASSPVYVIAVGEFPDVRPVDPDVLRRLSDAARPVRAFSPANLRQDTGQVIDAGTGENAVLFFAQPYPSIESRKAFAIGGAYANAMSLQRYIFELREEQGRWRIWDSARWGGEGSRYADRVSRRNDPKVDSRPRPAYLPSS